MALSSVAAPNRAGAASGSDDIAATLAVPPPEFDLGDHQIRLGLDLVGAFFGTHQSSGPAFSDYDFQHVSGLALGNVRVQRTLDNGMVLGVGGNFLLYRDDFSADNYDNDSVQKVFLF